MDIINISPNNNTNLIYTAAINLKLDCDLISDKFGLLKISKGDRQIRFFLCTASVNSAASRAIVLNKYLCSQILSENHFYVPESLFINTALDANYFEEAMNFLTTHRNIVIKPIEEYGGHGVTLNIKDEQALEKAINHAASFGNKIIAENFITGKNYRILVFMNQIVDIVERIPAFVVGDGISTIEQLIEQKNETRVRLLLRKIEIDDSLYSTLSNQNLSFKSIPGSNIRIELKEVCNLSAGGETASIDISKIPKESLDSFINISKTFDLNLAGIDLIAEDIYKPLENNGYINEVNSAPSMEVHSYADMKINLSAVEKILKIYFNLN